MPEKDERLLRNAALRTWRYFAEFSTEEHNWLVPDNVQEKPPAIAARVSPTNLGCLLNARQVACDFGYLTIPEFAHQTERTLATVAKLRRYRGHLLNWYDTRSLQPLAPALVSAVDSGNLLASLWTLQQGCLDLLTRPVLQKSVADGFLDHLRALVSLRAFSSKRFTAFRKEIKRQDSLQYLLKLTDTDFDADHQGSAADEPFQMTHVGLWNNRIRDLTRFDKPYGPTLRGCCPSLLRFGTILRLDQIPPRTFPPSSDCRTSSTLSPFASALSFNLQMEHRIPCTEVLRLCCRRRGRTRFD